MRTLRFRLPIKRAWIVLGAIAVMSIGAAVPALADSVTGTAAVTGGSLSQSGTSTPAFTVVLDGTDQTGSATFTTNVTDPRGLGTGWHMTISATTLTSTTPSTSFADTGTFSITAATAACASGSSCSTTTNGTTMPAAITSAASSPSAVPFFSAASGAGKGKFVVTSTMHIAVPATTLASTSGYTSTITVAIATGP